MQLRMVTYNIHGAVDCDNKKRPAGIADTLRQAEADIIALQEVQMLRRLNRQSMQAAYLAKSLKMYYAYGPVTHSPTGSSGNAILSRYPITRKVNHMLPNSRDKRCCLQVDLHLHDCRLTFLNLHLGLNQVERFRHLKYYILPLINSLVNPYVLAGDFNAVPEHPEIKLLNTLVDTFLFNSGPILYSFPAVRPEARIDYIFVRPSLPVAEAYIMESTASDHLPVVSTIEI